MMDNLRTSIAVTGGILMAEGLSIFLLPNVVNRVLACSLVAGITEGYLRGAGTMTTIY